MDALYSLGESKGTEKQAFTWEAYKREGGAESVLPDYLPRTLSDRTDASDTWRLLARFVAEDGQSGRSLGISELTDVLAGVKVKDELDYLVDKGLLQTYESSDLGQQDYRLTHDYLAGAIQKYIEKNSDKAGWKLAGDWLDQSKREFIKSRNKSTQFDNSTIPLIEEFRYFQIYQYKDKLKFSDESVELLIRTALHLGHAGLGDWLFIRLYQEASLQSINLDELFSEKVELRQTTRMAVMRDIKEKLPEKYITLASFCLETLWLVLKLQKWYDGYSAKIDTSGG